ncbi:MAG TPA: LytTR family DNA-binding domain-containing protein, partial [Usitatibacter sp.]|nr:LytTR family DNA-binding domain-containing protein [Usitatibacter sp.]
ERLAATVQRLKSRAAPAADAGALGTLLEELRARIAPSGGRAPLQWITASVGKETRLILVDDVAYFKADEKYTAVATAEGEALIRKPIRELLAVLDPAVFKQVHRSTIVNMKAIAAVSRDDSGRGTLRLRNRPETLTVSLPYMTLFRNM